MGGCPHLSWICARAQSFTRAPPYPGRPATLWPTTNIPLSPPCHSPFHQLPTPSSYPGAGPGLCTVKPLVSCCHGSRSAGCQSWGRRTAEVCSTTLAQTRSKATGLSIYSQRNSTRDPGGGEVGKLFCTLPLLAELSPYLLLEASWDLSCWDSGVWGKDFTWLNEFTAGEFTCWTKKKFHSITLKLLTWENVLDVCFKAKKASSKNCYVQHMWQKKINPDIVMTIIMGIKTFSLGGRTVDNVGRSLCPLLGCFFQVEHVLLLCT